jgi:hypothetical protein
VRGPRSGRDIRGRSEPGRRSDESVRRVPTQQRHKRQAGDLAEYRDKELEQRRLNPIPDSCPIVFLEIEVGDPSDFAYELDVRGVDVDGYRVLRTRSPAVLNALAAIMLRIRDETDIRPHLHFQWSEGHPLAHLVRFILLGLGETAPVTREILRRAEKTSVADRSSTSAAAPRSQTVLAPVTSAQPLRRQQLDFVSHPSRDQERTGAVRSRRITVTGVTEIPPTAPPEALPTEDGLLVAGIRPAVGTWARSVEHAGGIGAVAGSRAARRAPCTAGWSRFIARVAAVSRRSRVVR